MRRIAGIGQLTEREFAGTTMVADDDGLLEGGTLNHDVPNYYELGFKCNDGLERARLHRLRQRRSGHAPNPAHTPTVHP